MSQDNQFPLITHYTYDNKEYEYIMCQGISVIINSNGYYNATKICKDNNKDFTEWLQLDYIQPLLMLYSQRYGIPIENDSETDQSITLIMQVKEQHGLYKGYCIHPKLVDVVCNWCDIKYAHKVDQIKKKLKDIERRREFYMNLFKELKDDKRIQLIDNYHYIRIYDIITRNGYEDPLLPYHDQCVWWMSFDFDYVYREYRLLLQVKVTKASFNNLDYKRYCNRFNVNHHTNTVRQSKKKQLYEDIMNKLDIVEVNVNEISENDEISDDIKS